MWRGEIIRYLLNKEYQNIFGIDFAENIISKLKKDLVGTKAQIYYGSISNLEEIFSEDKFNLIISSMSLHHETYEKAKDLLRLWDSFLHREGFIYILTRSDSTITDEIKISDSTFFMPKLSRQRVHFNKKSLERIIPKSWRTHRFEEVFYNGRSAPISSFIVTCSKVY